MLFSSFCNLKRLVFFFFFLFFTSSLNTLTIMHELCTSINTYYPVAGDSRLGIMHYRDIIKVLTNCSAPLFCSEQSIRIQPELFSPPLFRIQGGYLSVTYTAVAVVVVVAGRYFSFLIQDCCLYSCSLLCLIDCCRGRNTLRALEHCSPECLGSCRRFGLVQKFLRLYNVFFITDHNDWKIFFFKF